MSVMFLRILNQLTMFYEGPCKQDSIGVSKKTTMDPNNVLNSASQSCNKFLQRLTKHTNPRYYKLYLFYYGAFESQAMQLFLK